MDMKIDTRALARDLITRISEPASVRRIEDENPTLADIGYDSLSIVELIMEVEAEMEDRGITTDIDDDVWSVVDLVSNVENDIVALLEGRDIR